jgi:hypothetical protein
MEIVRFPPKFGEEPKFITAICKQCGRKFTYKRIGKREWEYCSDKCKQKYYREHKQREEIERKKQLIKDL